MSRGFVKEEDQEEPIFIPPRAALPEQEVNYVTPAGLKQLEAERAELENSRKSLPTDNDSEYRRDLAVLEGRLRLLAERIHSARVIDRQSQPPDEVRFGAEVTFVQLPSTNPKVFQIVGVDEADISKGKISFISPIAQILIGKKVGNRAVLKLERQDRIFEITGINY